MRVFGGAALYRTELISPAASVRVHSDTLRPAVGTGAAAALCSLDGQTAGLFTNSMNT
jgi:hypothetical protein